jgi:ubiquinone/menaquinone biosynthesis C-methylase UbiE
MPDEVDVGKLDARTVARHLAKPEGAIGVAITAGLNRTNEGAYAAAISALKLRKGDRLLEIGFGNGHEIARLIGSASGISYHGVEISETMISEAASRNASAIAQGQVILHNASSSSLPFGDGSFDKVLALNTLYFWSNPLTDLGEIRRVLRAGGRLVIGAIAPASAAKREVFQHGFRLYEQNELIGLLNRAGFHETKIQTLNEQIVSPTGQKTERQYFIVAGQTPADSTLKRLLRSLKR